MGHERLYENMKLTLEKHYKSSFDTQSDPFFVIEPIHSIIDEVVHIQQQNFSKMERVIERLKQIEAEEIIRLLKYKEPESDR